MAILKLLFLVGLSAALMGEMSGTARAETFRVLAGEIAPYAYRVDNRIVGVSIELTAEIAKRLGHKTEFEIMPFPRATNEINQHPEVLMLQVARVEERDSRFIWVADLFDEPFHMFVRADSGIDPDFFFQNQPVPGPIGVLRGGISQKVALDYGLAPLEPASDELIDAHKIVSGRISSWLGSYNTARGAMRRAGYDPDLLRMGRMVKHYHLYLVAGKDSSALVPERWADVLQKMKLDGTYQKILERYHYCQRAIEVGHTQYGVCP
jgi:ABC-type amino acid transport substrate-binding protein